MRSIHYETAEICNRGSQFGAEWQTLDITCLNCDTGKSRENRCLPVSREEPLTHVQAYTVGYDREIRLLPGISSAVGAQVSMYGVDAPLDGPWPPKQLEYSVRAHVHIQGCRHSVPP
jgi:hypothetical protein